MYGKINMDEEDFLNEFASGSLRYTADQDYIAARMSYRTNLVEPFLWSSLHAIEKYLKAILLFNKMSAKGYGHNIDKLLDAVKEIDGLDLRLSVQVESFIQYLNEFGENRYFEGAADLREYALDNLDETVWYIRRYCYCMKYYKELNCIEIEPSCLEQDPKSYRLPGSNAFLEKIIKEELDAYPFLTWNNWFYGKQECNRASIRDSQRKFSVINPTLAFFGKEAYDVLKEYAQFSPGTTKYFKSIP
jgi:HEPN domain-containing protein